MGTWLVSLVLCERELDYLDEHLDDEGEGGGVHLPRGGDGLGDVGDGQGPVQEPGHGPRHGHQLPGPGASLGVRPHVGEVRAGVHLEHEVSKQTEQLTELPRETINTRSDQ